MGESAIKAKLEGLQAARALAALSVAYFHSYVALRAFPETAIHPIPFLKLWGFLGVDFFFAISGYVICLVISRPSFTVRSFAIKRVFRLYPMYWAAMAICALMIWAGKFPDPVTLGHFLYSMTLLPQHGPPAYSVSWTLEREVVFYALAAITVPIAGIGGLAVLLAALAYGGLVFKDPWSFHLVDIQQANFLGGVLVFLLSRWVRLWSPVALAAIVAGAGGLTYLWFVQSSIFPFATTICLSLVLLGMIHLELPWQHWTLRWLVHTGDASYSIYLAHGILFFYSYWFGAQIAPLPNWMCEPWRFGSLLVCVLISYATWRFIEVPFINIGNTVAARPMVSPPVVEPVTG
jgi:exopolysaccharide production protein ExoZ